MLKTHFTEISVCRRYVIKLWW